ncbi:hypothetical protein EBH_0015170 [Eimeria brunetti]|uniref:Uncharacterized protein n=1 Tax=Eimeria brunetti TaxID=51314 RepID=U6LAM2_9EIME|nr:hypothetical protein EBH_0015170 [Eimeria brunetti]
MLRHFFTLSQKSLFIALALGDFNRKRHAQIFIQTMRAQETEGEVSRKLALKRMVNKSREHMASSEDYLEYDFSSPRPFDLTIGITRCEEFLNSTTWTGSALQRMRSQLDFTLSKQLLTREGPAQAWQQPSGGGEIVGGGRADDNPSSGANTALLQADIASVEKNYLELPTVGKGDVSGKTTWKSMSTAARLSQLRFGGSKQLIANMPPSAYGVMGNILKPEHDSELEAFGCIECLQPADKVPYLGG